MRSQELQPTVAQSATADTRSDMPFSYRRLAWTLVWLTLANLAIRAGWLLYMHPAQISDFQWYFTHAVGMLQGHGYSAYGKPTAYWPIGWPYFLFLLFHLTGPSVKAGLIANALLSTLIVLVVYALAFTITRHPAIALAAAIGYTLLPDQIEWNSVLGSEELFTLLLVLSLWIYFFTRRSRWFPYAALAGIVLGLACDVRPIPLLFPAGFFLYEWLVVRRGIGQSLLRAAVVGLFMCLAVSPVTLRNAVALHHFIIVSTNGGVNLWQGLKTNSGYYWSTNPKINPMMAAYPNTYRMNAIGEHVAIQHILHHPASTLRNGLAKLYHLYQNESTVIYFTFGQQVPRLSASARALIQRSETYIYWLWMAIAVVGVFRFFSSNLRRHREMWLLALFLLYYAGVFLFFPAWDRFRYPVMPLWAIFFGVGVWFIVNVVRGRKSSTYVTAKRTSSSS